MSTDQQPAEDKSKIILPGAGGSDERIGVDVLDALLNHFSDGEASLNDLDPKVVRELREELQRGTFYGEDMKHLWIMLEKALARSGRSPGVGEEIRLLNLACGHCEEGSILSAFFGRNGKTVRQFAMDLRDHEIDKARRRYEKTEALFRKAGIPGIRDEDESNTVEFVADDATHLVGYGEVPSEFDVIFIRHQNLWHDKSIWKKIYEFALHRIAPESGVLVITSYFDREHILALELLKALGGRILFSEQNPNTRELDYPGKSIDRHVAVIVQSSGPLQN